MFKVISKAKSYQAVDVCIYCGCTTANLTNEHIIPLALNGNLILPKATCAICQKEINRFEHPCLRTMLGNFRATHGMRSRKNRRPSRLPIKDIYGKGQKNVRQVPVAHFPKTLLMFRQPPAGVLVGRAHTNVLEPDIFFAVHNSDTSRLFSQNWHLGFLQQRDFCLMLAKIAHAYTIAERGLKVGDEYRMLIPDYLLGRNPRHAEIVGGRPRNDPPAKVNVLHSLQIEERELDNKRYLIVHIRLFANVGAPLYHVVFGERLIKTEAKQTWP